MRGVRGLISALAISATAQAQKPERTGSELYSLSWVRGEGADGCPARNELSREVTLRLGRNPFDDAASLSIEIRVERLGEGFESRIHVRDERGQVIGRRALSQQEPECHALFSATALAVALLIDPDAASREPQPVASLQGTPEPAPPVAVAPAPPPQPAPAPVSPPPAQYDVPAPPPRAQEQHSETGSVALEGLAAAGLVPGLTPGFGLYAAGRPDERWGYALSALALPASEVSQDGATFEVGATAFGLAATLDFSPGESSRLALEVGPVVGALHTSVQDPDPKDAGDVWFVAASAGFRAQVTLTQGFFVSLRASGVVPLVRPSLYVAGEPEPVWEQSLVAGMGAAGLGLSFF